MSQQHNQSPGQLSYANKMFIVLGLAALAAIIETGNEFYNREHAPLAPVVCTEEFNPTNAVAHRLQLAVRGGKLVQYDGNRGVKCGNETTTLPLTADVNGHKEWFRLIGYGADVRVAQIKNPDAIIHEDLGTVDGHVITTTSHEGVVRLDTLDGVPGTVVHFNYGPPLLQAVGETSVNG